MTRENHLPKFAPRALSVLLVALFSGASWGSGFQILEQNASGIGNAYAGTAVVAEDASTIFFNPAGMSLLPQGKSLAAGVDAIQPSAKFGNGSSVAAFGQPAGGDGGDAGDLAWVPHGYFAMSLSPRLSVGLGLSAPFGLKTEYEPDWRGRFLGIKSDVKTLNLNPSIAYKVNDQVSVGFGLNYQKLDAELTRAVNYSAALCANPALAALCAVGALNGLAGSVKVSGDDSSWGYNLGALFQVSPTTRVGVAYRSPIKYHVTGDGAFERPTVVAGGLISAGTAAALNGSMALATPSGPVSLDIKLPDTFTLSASQQLSDRWEMLGDLSWTGWAKIQELRIVFDNGVPAPSVTPENWRNTVRVALGANYKLSGQTKVRFGLAYDQSPVENEFRTPRLPDNNRTWLAAGVQYKPTKVSALDIGYTYIFVKDGPINDNGGSTAGNGLLNGTYKNKVNVLGVQYSQTF